MEPDFIKVPPQAEGFCTGCVHFKSSQISNIPCNVVNGKRLTRKEGNCLSEPIIWAKNPAYTKAATVPTARKNDPATSKGNKRVNRYEHAVLNVLSQGGAAAGMTGKEIARYHDVPLNCITPRFAPLRRKGLIKDSGVRRDKQIVWVLA